MDLAIRQFQENLITYINSINLPPTVKKMAVSEILTQLNIAGEQAIKRQIEEREEVKDELQESIHEN